MSATWFCCRQRAGPLTKECRALRPRYGPQDTDEDRRAKADIKRHARCAVNRTPVDRLELRLALLGSDGMHYTLTFDNAHLPGEFYGVRHQMQNFNKRIQRHRASAGKPPSWPYIYAIEGLHGDHRYHIHLVSDYYELSPAEVEKLWTGGSVTDMEPVLLTRKYIDPETNERVEVSDGGFRRLAKYFNKEREDGRWIPLGRHPWSCSRALGAQLNPPEFWEDDTGVISVPDDAIYARRGNGTNDFGSFYYASYIVSDLNRARARARQS